MIARRALLASGCAAAAFTCSAGPLAPAREIVDVALVLLLDASGSMQDNNVWRVQQEGTAAALRALAGPILSQRIALAAMTYSDVSRQSLVLPWLRIDDERALDHAAATIEGWPERPAGSTAIGAALHRAYGYLEAFEGLALRRVVDVSSDGFSNAGPRPGEGRVQDVTVNGIVIPVQYGAGLAAHFRSEVIYGPGAFVIDAVDWQGYPAAMRRKLMQEIM